MNEATASEASLLAEPFLSVVIPVHNGAPTLPACLEATGLSEYSAYELIVVDDCSTDGGVSRVLPKARVVRHELPLGRAAARLSGARVAKGEVLVFVDPDVLIAKDFFGRIAKDFLNDTRLQCTQAVTAARPVNRGFTPDLMALLWRYAWSRGGTSSNILFGAAFAIRRDLFDRAMRQDESNPDREPDLGARIAAIGAMRVDRTLEVRRYAPRFLARTMAMYDEAQKTGRSLMARRRIPSHGGARLAEMAVAAVALVSAATWLFSLWSALKWLGLYAILRLPVLSYLAEHGGGRFALRSLPVLWLWSVVSAIGGMSGIVIDLSERWRKPLSQPGPTA